MVKRHARKNEARGRRSVTGGTHRQAVEAVRRDQVDAEGELTAVCTPNSHPHPDGRVEHGYQINVLDEGLSIVATVDLPEWESFRPASAGHRLIEHGYMIRPDARGPQAVNGWRRAEPGLDSWSVPVVRVDVGDLVRVVDYAPPALDGAEPCPECTGTAVSGAWFEQPRSDGRPPLAVAAACTACMGCGRAVHDGCAPGVHVNDDEDDVEELLDDELDEDQDQAEPCPSCGGREFYVMPTAPQPDDQVEDGPYEELLARARAQGVSEWDVTGAAVWGELDELLGDGAQALAEAAQRATVYLLTPCGCTEDRVRTVSRDELGGVA